MVEGPGGPASAGAGRDRQLQKLEDKSNKYAEKALAYLRAGQSQKAVGPNQRSIDIIGQLRVAEPDNERHLAQLAGKLHDHAEMLGQAGRITEAVIAARRSVEAYQELSGGVVTPEALTAQHLLELANGRGPTPGRPELFRQAAMTADAKCRLASLLARLSDDPGAMAQARQLGEEALATYKHLTQLNIKYQTDQLRVLSDYLRIVELTRHM